MTPEEFTRFIYWLYIVVNVIFAMVIIMSAAMLLWWLFIKFQEFIERRRK